MWDFKCIAAAICFTTSNILYIIHGALLMKQNSSSQSNSIATANDAAVNNNIYDDNNNYNQAQTHAQFHPMNFNFTVSW